MYNIIRSFDSDFEISVQTLQFEYARCLDRFSMVHSCLLQDVLTSQSQDTGMPESERDICECEGQVSCQNNYSSGKILKEST